MHRRQNPEFVNRRNSNRPPSPPSADVSVHSSHTDSSVKPSHVSSNTGSRQTQNSRIMSKSAQKKSDRVSLSEDLTEHGSNMSDVKSLSYRMEDLSLTSNSPIERDKAGKIAGDIIGKSLPITSSNMKEIRYGEAHQDNESSQNSRIMSKSAQKKSDRFSLSKDLTEHMSDVNSLSYRMEDVSLTSNSPVERDKAGKIAGDIIGKSLPITSSNMKEIRYGEAHQDNESSQNSRIMSKSAQKKSDRFSLSKDLTEHCLNMSDVKNLSYRMEDVSLTSNSPVERDKAGNIAGDVIGKSLPITRSNMKEIRYGEAHQDNESSQNSRIMSKSAQKKSDRFSLSKDLTEHMSDVKSLSYRMEDVSLTSNSPVERDKAGKIESGDITVKSSPITSSNIKEIRHGEAHQDNESSQKEMGVSAGSDTSCWYDICPPKKGSGVVLKTPLLQKNRERRNENKRNMEGNTISVLRPGMILLKKYLSLSDQVKLVKTCRELGKEPGGFYQPGYRDGALLNLKMMCLGKNWDPEKGYDDTKPPLIPHELSQLVERALNDSHAHLKEKHKKRNVEDILPPMSPNICIVNFYTKCSRLGLHQDKDESSQSLFKGLPVVSFSVGESAEFLYGDQRDVFQAEKVTLESGDVLIFGGKARNIYHGVSAILPNTAPPSLLEETNLRPGRLNLTFREY